MGDLRALQRTFHALPGLFLVLLPDAEFSIAAASAEYLQATHRDVSLFGRPLSTLFSDAAPSAGAEHAAAVAAIAAAGAGHRVCRQHARATVRSAPAGRGRGRRRSALLVVHPLPGAGRGRHGRVHRPPGAGGRCQGQPRRHRHPRQHHRRLLHTRPPVAVRLCEPRGLPHPRARARRVAGAARVAGLPGPGGHGDRTPLPARHAPARNRLVHRLLCRARALVRDHGLPGRRGHLGVLSRRDRAARHAVASAMR